jgi:pimeloyl-ACP methyl ester carboxylesterase
VPIVPSAHLNGIDVHYELEGSGPRLLFINGSGSTLAEAAPMLGGFRPHFQLLAHDQRGLGQTSVPDGPYTMAQYAADAAALADRVGWDTYRVVGISFGGMVAQELAVTHPDRIERLALVVTSPGGAGGSSYPLHTLADMDEASRDALGPLLLDTRFTPEWLDAHPVDRMLAGAMTQRAVVEKSADVVRGERLQLQARSHHDVWERLPRIACPTFVASGKYDGIAPAANGEVIASRVAGAEFHAYDGGHAALWQDRRALPELVDFLKG